MSNNIDSLLEYVRSGKYDSKEFTKKMVSFLSVEHPRMFEEQLTRLVIKAIKHEDELQVEKLFDLVEFISTTRLYIPHGSMVIPHGKDHHIMRCLKIDAKRAYSSSSFLSYICGAHHYSLELVQRVINMVYLIAAPMDIITSYFNSISFDVKLGHLLVQSAKTQLIPLHKIEKTVWRADTAVELRRRVRLTGILWVRHAVDEYISLPIEERDRDKLKNEVMKFYRTDNVGNLDYTGLVVGMIADYAGKPLDGWEVYLDVADIESVEYMSIVSKTGSEDVIKKCLMRDSVDYTDSLRACVANGSETKLIKVMREIGVDFNPILDHIGTDDPISVKITDLLKDPLYLSDDYLVDYLGQSQ